MQENGTWKIFLVQILQTNLLIYSGYKMLKELDFRELKKEFSLDFKGLIQVGSFVSKEFSILKELGMTDFIFIDANPNIMEQLLNNVDENCKVLNELISDEDYKLYTFIMQQPALFNALLL
jgi:hypothetical protein